MAAVSSLVNKTLSAKSISIVILLMLLGVILLKAFSSGGQQIKSGSQSLAMMDCYRAEMLMRMADIFDFVPKSKFIMQKQNGQVLDTKATTFAQANELLNSAAEAQPGNVIVLCKKIILEAHIGKSNRVDLEKLVGRANKNAAKPLSEKQQKLSNVILSIYGHENQNFENSKLEQETNPEIILKDGLKDGWYFEKALLQVYKIKNETKKYIDLNSEIQSKTWRYIFKLTILGLMGSLAALAGFVIILYQLIIVSDQNKKSKLIADPDKDNKIVTKTMAAYDWQTVALVFLAWFFTQILVGYMAGVLKQNGLISYSNSFSSASAIALIYLLSNGPALLYIYLLAFRPNHLNLFDGLGIHWKVDNHGRVALAVIGLLGWFAAMPIVLAAYFISSQFLGSAGSSNPIISIVMDAAQSNNFVAILLFYFTLGVLAPICEEGLFRGFLYGYLRHKHSMLFSNVLTSTLFAAAHMDPGAFLPLFCLGSIFAYLREKTGSIIPSMITHGLWNSATFTLILILFGT